jgi:transcriptional regulator with XRE-family HTH domain
LISEARKRAGLTQAELARRVGTQQSAIGRWERGEVQASLETVRRVVRACGLDLTIGLVPVDDSNLSLVRENLRLDAAERFRRGVARSRFAARVAGSAMR